jgi:TrmH family RNA methyltransferase
MTDAVLLTSRDNEKLKLARRVREGKESDLMLVEGVRLCRECLKSNIEIEFALIAREFSEPQLFQQIEDKNLPVYLVSEKLMNSVADTRAPQGIVLIARRANERAATDFLRVKSGDLPLTIYLHEVNNPSNLGAVIRAAEAAGVKGVIVSRNSADPFSPKSLRAAMGSAFRLQIATVTNLTELIDAAGEFNVNVVAVDINGDQQYTSYDWSQKTLLMFGSEAHGLPLEALGRSDSKLKIEMNSEVDSLNLAVSCGIVLFEARRQKMA